MNKAQTKHAVEVMQAYIDGKPIEYQRIALSPEPWNAVTVEASWDWWKFNYRVKPEPVEVYVWYNPNPPPHLRNIIGTSEACASDDYYWCERGYTKIKMREVQD